MSDLVAHQITNSIGNLLATAVGDRDSEDQGVVVGGGHRVPRSITSATKFVSQDVRKQRERLSCCASLKRSRQSGGSFGASGSGSAGRPYCASRAACSARRARSSASRAARSACSARGRSKLELAA